MNFCGFFGEVGSIPLREKYYCKYYTYFGERRLSDNVPGGGNPKFQIGFSPDLSNKFTDFQPLAFNAR